MSLNYHMNIAFFVATGAILEMKNNLIARYFLRIGKML